MLTDTACKKAKPGAKERKLADSHGLFLRVLPSGAKSWCWKYRFGGREKKLTIGPYPEIPLKAARDRRDAARQLLREGIDPAADKAQRKALAALGRLDSFEAIARAWHTHFATTRSPRYAAAVLARLEANAFPRLGRLEIRAITAPMVLEAIRAIEARGAHDMAHRVRNHISDVFVWAIASGLAEDDPAAVIRKALAPTDPRLRPALVRLQLARQVLTATEALTGAHWSTLLASRLLALTAARPGVVRLAEAGEFEDLDGPEPVWRIPAAKMKLTRARKRDATWEFVVPLSEQAAATARAAISASPACDPGRINREAPAWLFCGIGKWTVPISDSTLSKLYRDAGFAGVHVPHGWRSSFSTYMNERAGIAGQAEDRKIIDLMLAHVQPGVEPIYNRSAYLPRRRELAQEWADLLLEGLAPPDTLLPHTRAWRRSDQGARHERRTGPRGSPAPV